MVLELLILFLQKEYFAVFRKLISPLKSETVVEIRGRHNRKFSRLPVTTDYHVPLKSSFTGYHRLPYYVTKLVASYHWLPSLVTKLYYRKILVTKFRNQALLGYVHLAGYHVLLQTWLLSSDT